MAQVLKQKWEKMGSFLIENEGDNKEREKLTCRQTHHHHFRHFLQHNPLKEEGEVVFREAHLKVIWE